MANPAAVLSVLVKADTSKAVTGLTALQKKLESASKSADELTDKLFYLSQLRITPKIDLDTGRADEQVDALQGKLDRLGTGKTTATVEAATAHAREEIDRLANSDFTVHGSVDLDTGAAEAKIQLLKRQAAGIGGGIGGVGGGGSSAASSGGGLPFGIGFNMPTLIGAGIGLAPTVGASLAQGALGAGALGTAAAGAGAVGGAGIASVAVGGLGDITKALAAYTTQQQAAGAQAVQSAQQQLSAASAQHAAAQQIQTAEESLTQAQQQETFAQQALTLARKDAVRQLTDMRRAATESTTAEQQAKLNLEVARRALAQAPAGTSALELKQLQLSAKEAQQAFRDAGIARDRAHQDANKAQSQGVSQMPQVVAAQRSLASAQKAVADASNNVKQAEYAQAQASKQAALQAKALAISQGQVGIAMKELPASGREATKSIVDLKDAWEELSKPASNQFFGLISDGVNEMNRLLPMFARSAESSVGAVRDAFDKFLKSLNSPGFHTFIHTMTVTFAKGIGPLTKGFTNLARILERIAVAAAPGLIKLLQGFREMTGDWLKSTNRAKQLHQSVNQVINQFKDWLGLIGAVGQVLSALFLANTKGAKAGGNAVKQLTRTLQGWADWINTHRHKVNVFFINLLHTVEILAGALGNLATTLAPLSSAFIPISKAIVTITNALNHLKVGNVSALTVLLGALGARSLLGKAGLIGAGGAASEGGLLAGLAGGSAVGGLAVGGLGAAGAVGVAGAFTSKGGIPDTLKGNAVDTSIWSELLQKSIQQVIDKFGSFAKGVKHMSESQKQAFLGLIQDAHNAGQITDAVFNKLTATITGSTDMTTKAIKKWSSDTVDSFQKVMKKNKANADQFDATQKQTSMAVAKQAHDTATSYNNMAVVSGKGMDTLKKNTNNALKGLGVGKSIDFSTFTLQGTAGAHQRGGRIVPGKGSGDTVPAMLEPGEFVLNREAVAKIGGARLEALNKALPRFAKGGSVYSLPWPGGTSAFGELDRGIDVGGTGPVFAMDSGSVTKPNFNLFSNYGSATSGLVYRMDHPPKGYSPSSPYVYVYELFNPSASGRLKAGQTLGHITGGSGIEMGWATASGQPLADALGENIAARHALPRGLPTSISLQNFIRDIQAGKHITGGAAAVAQIKRQIIKGPKGALGGAAQMSLDQVWHGANAFLAKQAPKGGALPGAAGAPIKGLPPSLRKYNREYPANGGSTMPMNKIAELAEWAGRGRVPGKTMAQVTIGESTGHPGAVSPDHGYGLWQITDPYGNSAISRAGFKGYSQMLNPISNAQVMAIMYTDNPSAALGQTWHGISGVTSSNAHYTGRMLRHGGFVMPPFGGNFAGGGVVPGPVGSPRTVVAHGGERIDSKGSRYAITITNWKQGTGYMEEIADGAVNGQRRLGNQLSRMSRA